MEKVKFYTTHCAICRGLELQLKKKNIQYEEVYINPENPEEVQIMLDLGLRGPGIEVDGRVMNAKEASDWIKGQ